MIVTRCQDYHHITNLAEYQFGRHYDIFWVMPYDLTIWHKTGTQLRFKCWDQFFQSTSFSLFFFFFGWKYGSVDAKKKKTIKNKLLNRTALIAISADKALNLNILITTVGNLVKRLGKLLPKCLACLLEQYSICTN